MSVQIWKERAPWKTTWQESMPRASMVALCMAGEKEWVAACPMTAISRLTARGSQNGVHRTLGEMGA